jgi:hypothetical protein
MIADTQGPVRKSGQPSSVISRGWPTWIDAMVGSLMCSW